MRSSEEGDSMEKRVKRCLVFRRFGFGVWREDEIAFRSTWTKAGIKNHLREMDYYGYTCEGIYRDPDYAYRKALKTGWLSDSSRREFDVCCARDDGRAAYE